MRCTGKPHDKDCQGREQHEGCSLGQQDVRTAPGIGKENAHRAVPLLSGDGRRAHDEAHYCNDNGAERPEDIADGQPAYVDIVSDAKQRPKRFGQFGVNREIYIAVGGHSEEQEQRQAGGSDRPPQPSVPCGLEEDVGKRHR